MLHWYSVVLLLCSNFRIVFGLYTAGMLVNRAGDEVVGFRLLLLEIEFIIEMLFPFVFHAVLNVMSVCVVKLLMCMYCVQCSIFLSVTGHLVFVGVIFNLFLLRI